MLHALHGGYVDGAHPQEAACKQKTAAQRTNPSRCGVIGSVHMHARTHIQHTLLRAQMRIWWTGTSQAKYAHTHTHTHTHTYACTQARTFSAHN